MTLTRLVAALVAAAIMPVAMYAHKGHEHAPMVNAKAEHITPATQWQGKRVAYLGDSMTDPRNTSSTLHYWNYLDTLMGIKPVVYARSGYKWDGIYKKANELYAACPPDSIDAIFIWAGTNDYNGSVPLGEFYTERMDTVSVNGVMSPRKHRTMCMNDSTFCGNINRSLHFLKTHYPTKQIVVLTPIHRAYAKFSAKNEQPDEHYANGQNLYVEEYIETLKRGALLWAVPVIDLYAVSGLMPVLDEHTQYFHDVQTDRLHPNDPGHYRLARTIQMQLLALPPTF